jgi:hypothetical protein
VEIGRASAEGAGFGAEGVKVAELDCAVVAGDCGFCGRLSTKSSPRDSGEGICVDKFRRGREGGGVGCA